MEIQDGRYFCKIVYVFTDSQMYRSFESIKNLQRFDFLKICVIPGGNAPPKQSNGGIVLPPFQIDVGGTKEQPPPLGYTFTRRVNHNYKMHGQSPLL